MRTSVEMIIFFLIINIIKRRDDLTTQRSKNGSTSKAQVKHIISLVHVQ